MPLDNIRVEIEDWEVTLSWSDCSHILEMKKGYKTTFKGVSHWGDVLIMQLTWTHRNITQQIVIEDLLSRSRTYQVKLPSLHNNTILLIATQSYKLWRTYCCARHWRTRTTKEPGSQHSTRQHTHMGCTSIAHARSLRIRVHIDTLILPF